MDNEIFGFMHTKRVKAVLIISLFLVVVILLTPFISRYGRNNYFSLAYYTKHTDINSTHSASSKLRKPKLAIIIDDFGQNQNGVKEMMEIKRHFTFAVMPFLDYSRRNAVDAHKKGYEVIVHLPMQSQKQDIASWLGPRPVKVNSSDSEIKKIVSDSINAVPYAAGVNIHMGALASGNERVVSDVMKVVKGKNAYFIDSLTTSNTVCKIAAKKVGIKFAERDVFLECSHATKYYIIKQLLAAGDLAVKNGYAIAIGHVGSAGGRITAEAIKETIPSLERKGIEFVYISELFNYHAIK